MREANEDFVARLALGPGVYQSKRKQTRKEQLVGKLVDGHIGRSCLLALIIPLVHTKTVLPLVCPQAPRTSA